MTWDTVPLGKVAWLNPRSDSTTERATFLGMADVSERGTTSSGVPLAPGDLKSGYTPFRDRDILLAKITPCFENGKIAQAILPTKLGWGSTEFHVIRPDEDVLHPRYALHFLRSGSVRSTGTIRMTGSAGQRRVPLSFLEQLEIPLPPLTEQRRIAAILDEADALRRTSAAQLAVNEAQVEAAFTNLMSTPTATTTIGELLLSTQYGTSERAGAVGAFPILRMGNITSTGQVDLRDMKYIDIAPQDQDKYLVEPGDLLFNRTNSVDLVGKTAIYREPEPRAFAGYLVRARPRTPLMGELVSGYLNSRLGKGKLRLMAKSIVGMANINAKELAAMSIPLPGDSALGTYAVQVGEVRENSRRIAARARSLDELFASLQHRAFRGEL